MTANDQGSEPLAGYRTFSVDYTGGKFDPGVYGRVLDAVAALFEAEGRKVQGGFDGPMSKEPERHSDP